MKISTLLITLFFTFSSLVSHTQTVNIAWADPVICKKSTFWFPEFVGETSKLVYTTFRHDNDLGFNFKYKKLKIVAYDKENMKIVSSYMLYNIDSNAFESSEQLRYRETIIKEDKIYVFWEKELKDGSLYYVQTFNKQFQQLNKTQKIYESGSAKEEDKYYNRFFLTNKLGEIIVGEFYSKKEGENIMLKYTMVDSNCTFIASNEIKLPVINHGANDPLFNTSRLYVHDLEADKQQVYDIDYKLGEDDNFYIKNTLEVNKAIDPFYSILNLTSGKMKTYPLKPEGKIVFDFDCVEENNAIKLFGLFGDSNDANTLKNAQGVFYATLNPKTFEMTSDFSYEYFGKEKRNGCAIEDKSQPVSKMAKYSIESTQSVNGEIVLFYNQFENVQEVKTKVQQVGSTTKVNSFVIGNCDKENIYITKIDKNGKLIWTSMVKGSARYLTGKNVHDVDQIYVKNKFYLLFNNDGHKMFYTANVDFTSGEVHNEPYELKTKPQALNLVTNKTTKLNNGFYIVTKTWPSSWTDKTQDILGRISF